MGGKGLDALRSLNLYKTRITDAGLEILSGMKNLDNLYLRETLVTDEGIAALKRKLPKCRVIK